MSEQNNPEKKTPFYKKKWFIAIIVIIVIAAIFDQGKDDKAEPKDVAVEEKEEKEKPKDSDKKKEEKEKEKKEKKEEKDSVEEAKDESKDKDETDEPQKEMTSQEKNKQLISDYKIYIKSAAELFIEDKELQRIKSLRDYTVAVYSNDIIHDLAGSEYPLTFLVNGRYEEKGTGKLNDFVTVLGYKNEDDIKEYKAYLLQYYNDQTGTTENVIPEEEDIFFQLDKALKENQ